MKKYILTLLLVFASSSHAKESAVLATFEAECEKAFTKTKRKSPKGYCNCLAENLRIKKASDRQAQAILDLYRDKNVNDEDDDIAWALHFDMELAEICPKNSKFRVKPDNSADMKPPAVPIKTKSKNKQ